MYYKHFYRLNPHQFPICDICKSTTYFSYGNIFGGVAYMLASHFGKYLKDKDISISIPLREDALNEMIEEAPYILTNYQADKDNIIFYDMEHGYPTEYVDHLGPYGDPMSIACYPIIWSYQIENYKIFKEIGRESDFKFVPLRYTDYYDLQGYTIKDVSEFAYEIQFEGKLMESRECEYLSAESQSTLRNRIVTNLLSKLRDLDGKLSDDIIEICVSNTHNMPERCRTKQISRYCIDIPRLDCPQTINNFRIWENILLNKQTIVVDPSNITMDYFGDLIIKLHDASRFEYDIELIAYNNFAPLDIRERFKEMTDSDEAYDNYRIRIIREFSDRTGIMVPDSVLKLD